MKTTPGVFSSRQGCKEDGQTPKSFVMGHKRWGGQGGDNKKTGREGEKKKGGGKQTNVGQKENKKNGIRRWVRPSLKAKGKPSTKEGRKAKGREDKGGGGGKAQKKGVF